MSAVSFIWIIGAVIWLIFYVARSVEKQNAQEQKRRQQNRSGTTRSHAPSVQNVSRTEQRPPRRQESVTEQVYSVTQTDENVWMKKYYETAQRMNQSVGSRIVPEQNKPQMNHSRTAEVMERSWRKNRDAVRQAFIFSECIGKPRAVEPHRFFSGKRIN
ncbi:MAG: hypothetical protein K0Q56_1217 [Sporolactobacillus laevolacticus]|nr:hypothetical protein [Sporolactobacillus laevolacticus]